MKTPEDRNSTGHIRTRQLNVFDAFSGCGGMSTGFLQAGGFRIAAACESNPHAAGAYRLNHPGTVMVEDDIRTERAKQAICGAFAGMPCDVVIGGVPCKAYTKSKRRDPDDPRGRLYEPFIDLVARLGPAAAVIENVPDILTYRHADGTLAAHRIAASLNGAKQDREGDQPVLSMIRCHHLPRPTPKLRLRAEREVVWSFWLEVFLSFSLGPDAKFVDVQSEVASISHNNVSLF